MTFDGADLFADASATLGIIGRKGIGKVRHLDTSNLCLQNQHLRGALDFKKVAGTSNDSDAMTKYLPQDLMKRHISAMGAYWSTAKAAAGIELHCIGH